MPETAYKGSALAKARSNLMIAHRGPRYGRNPDPEAIEAARRDLATEKIAAYVERVLGQAPPLTDAQRTRLAELLKPVRRPVDREAAVRSARQSGGTP